MTKESATVAVAVIGAVGSLGMAVIDAYGSYKTKKLEGTVKIALAVIATVGAVATAVPPAVRLYKRLRVGNPEARRRASVVDAETV